jgi:hypothetical protein
MNCAATMLKIDADAATPPIARITTDRIEMAQESNAGRQWRDAH